MESKKDSAIRSMTGIDLETVRQLAALQATHDEMAAVLGIRPAAFKRKFQRSRTLRETIETGRQQGQLKLRQIQIRIAQDGNAAMAQWLGKIVLGQRDPQGAGSGSTSELPELNASDIREQFVKRLVALSKTAPTVN